jgi:hypothetical protein
MNRNIASQFAGFAVVLAVFATPSVAIGDPAVKLQSAPGTGVSGALNATHGATQSAVRDARDAASRRAEQPRTKQRARTRLSGSHQP